MKSVWLSRVFVMASCCLLFGQGVMAAPQGEDEALGENEVQTIDISGQPIQGTPEANVVIVEFFDYQCPACGRQARDILPELRKNYIETGKIAYVYMDFPLETIHPLAFQAAEAAACAGDQGKYLEMHSTLFTNQGRLREHDLYDHAESLGLDISASQDCMVPPAHADGIRSDIALGESLGARRTPSIFLTVRDADNPERVTVSKLVGK